MDARSRKLVALEERWGAPNYAPLPVLLCRARGPYAWDLSGRRYLDCLSAYSALNQGHLHPRIVAAARRQLGRLTLTSRGFHNDLLGPFLERLCRLSRSEMALVMNSGAEAVETAVKGMRLWGHRVKGIPDGRQVIIAAEGNFHGRTTTLVSFSTEPKSLAGFRPATPGFKTVPFGDAAALERALGPRVCGVLLEPIQGEAGVRLPPPGYLRSVAAACRRKRVLLCLDEIQTGFGRTGRLFAADHEGVRPDLMTLGKALSGGILPVSAVVGRREVLGLFKPGMHGSTFGGNALACAVGLAALDVIERERLPQRAARVGALFLKRLKSLRHPKLREARGRGLLLALEFTEPLGRRFCELLLARGVLAKDAHDTTVRFAPPLTIGLRQVSEACAAIESALTEL